MTYEEPPAVVYYACVSCPEACRWAGTLKLLRFQLGTDCDAMKGEREI